MISLTPSTHNHFIAGHNACSMNDALLLNVNYRATSHSPFAVRCMPPRFNSRVSISRLVYSNGMLQWPIFQSTLGTASAPINVQRGYMADLSSIRDHIMPTDALIHTYWLRIPERIRYRIAVLSTKSYTSPHRDTSSTHQRHAFC